MGTVNIVLGTHNVGLWCTNEVDASEIKYLFWGSPSVRIKEMF